jgi:selenide,water dikinase
MIASVPIRHDLVLVGGGHAHVAVLKRFGMNPLPGARITLVSDTSAAPYSGMLPGLIAGHYSPHEAHVELRPLCRFANAQFIQASITGLDLNHRQLLFRDRPPIGFDTLSINTGSTPSLHSIPGALDHGLPVKPVDRFLQGWAVLRDRLAQLPTSGVRWRVVVVGGGAGSVELIFALRHRWLEDQAQRDEPTASRPEFHLVTAARNPLPTHGRAVQRLTERELFRQAIEVHTERRVVEALPDALVCADGSRIPFDALIWATHASPAPWVATSGLATDAAGFIAVTSTLQSTSHPFIFAAGDIAAVLEFPRPKSGVFAVRQGPPLAENLRRIASGASPLPFIPQSRALNLLSTGDRHAIASYGSLALAGRWVWRIKNWIDRRWMRAYQELPMSRTSVTAGVPPAIEGGVSPPGAPSDSSAGSKSVSNRWLPPHRPCGGCAAKVPAEVLSRVLRRLQPLAHPGILIGLDAPDDAAAIVPPPGLALVQTVDSFHTFLQDPYLFGRIAALHGLNDLFAMGAEPHSALAVATLPSSAAHILEETLFQLLSGVLAELNAHGTALVGGHSAEGSQLTLGLTLNGFAAPGLLLRKGGLRPGDVLILTKGLGTGTLFAADMIGRANGSWIETAIASMTLSGQRASRCLVQHRASACTDISGFGLAGHLLEMLRASGMSASVDVDSLPVLDGALETIRAGLLSSLHPHNRSAARAFTDVGSTLEHHTHFELLFDPQTSGGLLGGIPAAQAERCLATLHQLGYQQAAVIGRVLPRTDIASAPWIQCHIGEQA